MPCDGTLMSQQFFTFTFQLVSCVLLNQDSTVYLEKDGCQALRTRKNYMQIFFWMILLVFS